MKISLLFFSLVFATNIFAQSNTIFAPGKYALDSADAKLNANWLATSCADTNVAEYYSVHQKYIFSGQALLQKFNALYTKPIAALQSGFVTVRFVVNCKGETGYFNVYETNLQKQAYLMNAAIKKQIVQFVKSLENFPIASFQNKAVNYYYYFNFKIMDNEIKTISP